MKFKRVAIKKFKNIQAFTPVLVVALLVVVGAVIYNFNTHAATAGFTLASSADAYKVGDTFTVDVVEDSGSVCTNVVQADVTYPSNLLGFEGYSLSNSKLDSAMPATSGNGQIHTTQYTTRKECGSGNTATSGVSGQQLLGTATFTVIAEGNGTIDFQNSSIAISAADNKTDVAAGTSSKSFVFTSVPVITPNPTPNPDPSPNPTPDPVPNPTPDSDPTPSVPNPVPMPQDDEDESPVTSITPDGSDTPIELNDNDVVEVTDPVDVQPLPVQPDGINKIEYYLGKDLVATVKSAPYTYRLDTGNYLNGTYNMTTKTYYSNGQTKSVSQKVVIKNQFGLTQVKLWLMKYVWLVIILLLVLAGAIIAIVVHRRNSGGTSYYGGNSNESAGDYAVSSGTTIQPGSQTTNDAAPNIQVSPSQDTSAPEPQVYRPSGPSSTN